MASDGSGGDAYATKLVGPSTGYTIVSPLMVPASCFTALGTGTFADWLAIGDPAGSEDGLYGHPAPITDFGADSQGGATPPPAPAPGVWFLATCTLAHVSGTTWDVVWNINAVDLFPSAPITLPNDETQQLQVNLGAIFAAAIAGELYYARSIDVKDAGGSSIFSDDFSSGDLSAWDSVTGAPTIVDDIGAPAGICIALANDTLDVYKTWTRLDG